MKIYEFVVKTHQEMPKPLSLLLDFPDLWLQSRN